VEAAYYDRMLVVVSMESYLCIVRRCGETKCRAYSTRRYLTINQQMSEGKFPALAEDAGWVIIWLSGLVRVRAGRIGHRASIHLIFNSKYPHQIIHHPKIVPDNPPTPTYRISSPLISALLVADRPKNLRPLVNHTGPSLAS